MSQPTPYVRHTTFAQKVDGIALNIELDRVKETSDETLTNLALIQ